MSGGSKPLGCRDRTMSDKSLEMSLWSEVTGRLNVGRSCSCSHDWSVGHGRQMRTRMVILHRFEGHRKVFQGEMARHIPQHKFVQPEHNELVTGKVCLTKCLSLLHEVTASLDQGQ